MSKWGALEGLAGDLLRTGIEDIASWAVKKLRGDATDDTAREMIEKIAKSAIRAAVRELEHELHQQADKFGLAVALLELGPLTQGVLDAFEPRGTIKPLGIPMEEMPPDWHPPKGETPE